jgi:hypothetical protein
MVIRSIGEMVVFVLVVDQALQCRSDCLASSGSVRISRCLHTEERLIGWHSSLTVAVHRFPPQFGIGVVAEGDSTVVRIRSSVVYPKGKATGGEDFVRWNLARICSGKQFCQSVHSN